MPVRLQQIAQSGMQAMLDEARRHPQGLSTYKIAARFGVAQCTVWRALKQ